MLKKIIKKLIEFWDQKIFKSSFITVLISLVCSTFFACTEKYSLWLRIAPLLTLLGLILISIICFFYQEVGFKENAKLSQILSQITKLPLKKYGTVVVLVVVTFFVGIYVISKYFEIEKSHQNLFQQLERKEPQEMKSQNAVEPLTKFTAYEFLENSKEFGGYAVNRKKVERLNPDKLVNLMYVYFRSVLLYPSPEMREYRLNGPDGGLYQITFPGHNEKGQEVLVSLGEMSDTLLANVCTDLLKSAQITHIVSLVDLFTKAIATPSLDKRHKFNILNAENSVLKEKFSDALRMMTENKAKDALDIRKDLVVSELQILKQVEDETNPENEKNREALYNLIGKYLQCRIDVMIANNKFVDIFQSLYEELKENDDKQITINLLSDLVIYNNLFLFERKEVIREVLSEHLNLIGEEQYSRLVEMLNFSPEKIELKDSSIELVESDKEKMKFKNVDYGKVRTIISFVVHHKSKEDYVKFNYPDKYTIELIRCKNLFDDPVFRFLNSLQLNINGMPLSIFSDAVGNVNNSTVIYITMNDFFHPDFDLVNDRIQYIDFEEKEAKLGRKYYPHKDRIVEIIRELHREHSKEIPFDIKKEEININLISNYLVNYIDENNDSIFHKVHTITNLDSYLKVKNRYLEKIAELNLSDDFLDIRELLFETDIVTSNSLKKFISRTLNLTVKKSIELRGIYKFLWRDSKLREPLNESDIQPIIKTHLQPILEAKGIQTSREVIAANGSLDFLCTYTHNGNLFKVGIELKKAHHENLIDGLVKQLPQYLKDEGTKHGIFLVLWFKNDTFRQPAKYNSIPDLIKDLEQNIPQNYKFEIVVIDCTKQVSPSRL